MTVSFNRLEGPQCTKQPGSCPDVNLLESISDVVIDGKVRKLKQLDYQALKFNYSWANLLQRVKSWSSLATISASSRKFALDGVKGYK